MRRDPSFRSVEVHAIVLTVVGDEWWFSVRSFYVSEVRDNLGGSLEYPSAVLYAVAQQLSSADSLQLVFACPLPLIPILPPLASPTYAESQKRHQV
jgi:hypothetical protein